MVIDKLRQFKIYDIAMFDVVMTYIFGVILLQFSGIQWGIHTSLILFILLVIVGNIMHKIFGVKTKFNVLS